MCIIVYILKSYLHIRIPIQTQGWPAKCDALIAAGWCNRYVTHTHRRNMHDRSQLRNSTNRCNTPILHGIPSYHVYFYWPGVQRPFEAPNLNHRDVCAIALPWILWRVLSAMFLWLICREGSHDFHRCCLWNHRCDFGWCTPKLCPAY